MWPNPQFPADLVTFTEKNPEWKTSFLCSELIDFISPEVIRIPMVKLQLKKGFAERCDMK